MGEEVLRGRDLLMKRFRDLMATWLAKQSRYWRGSAGELYDELDALKPKFGTYLYASSGLSKALAECEPFIRSLGWTLSFRRSNGKRTIEFNRPRAIDNLPERAGLVPRSSKLHLGICSAPPTGQSNAGENL